MTYPLILSPHGEKRWLALLAMYLDDSGEDGEPIVTLAGFISTEMHWREFEDGARRCFDAIGLEYLHTVDLHHGRGFFKGWSRDERAALANGFCQLLRAKVAFGFEFSVLKSQFEAKKKAAGVKSASPLGFCMQGIMDRAFKNPGIADALKQPEVTLSFVIESGHKNSPDVLARFKAVELFRRETFLLTFAAGSGYAIQRTSEPRMSLSSSEPPLTG